MRVVPHVVWCAMAVRVTMAAMMSRVPHPIFPIDHLTVRIWLVTNAFSKKVENHSHAVALHFTY